MLLHVAPPVTSRGMTSEGFPSHRILGDLRQQILAGGLAPGARLPSENDLAGRYATSRPTVRRALERLQGDGLIISEQGRGWFVRPKPHVRMLITGSNYRRHRALGLPGFNAQALEQGMSPRQDITEVSRISAPADVAQQLDLDEDSPVVVRRRVFLLDDEPAALTDSYYPASWAAGTAIERPERVKGGVHALIEDDGGPIGRRIARSVDDITTRMPTPDETRKLRLPQGMPVFRVLRTVYDSENRPLEVQETIAAADRHGFRYEVDMG
jgi:GntR family transcriptional regulator